MPLLWMIADACFIEPVIGPKLNAFRASKGLPPVKRVLRDWWNSPDLIIGMFPAWYAKPQADWWPQTKLTGFPLYDERGKHELPAALNDFLDHGPPPIAFTAGSAMIHAAEFFRDATLACQHLGRRGLLLTRHSEQIPSQLPQSVMHLPYAPFSELLRAAPRSCTTAGSGAAQGLAAGVPQLVTPMTFDQPDNANRLRELGVAQVLPFTRFTARRAPRRCSDYSAIPRASRLPPDRQ